MVQPGNDFNAIKISLASPGTVRQWSWGEVTKPETINYRTLRPEKEGLFCERIFGPTKDWECYCGKYKKIRFKGLKCDRCHVEVARAKVRRERMGHITLAAPVAHIWFSKGTPSRIGLLLNLSPRNLDRVLYFAQYLVTNIEEELRDKRLAIMREDMKTSIEELEGGSQARIDELSEGLLINKAEAQTQEIESEPATETQQEVQIAIAKVREELESNKAELEERLENEIADLENLRVSELLSENKYRQLSDKFYDIFNAAMGAEAVLEVLQNLDLDDLRDRLLAEMNSSSGQRQKKAIKRMRVVEAFRKSGNKPEWMVFTLLPVLPPDLRPMVQLDGGRFATSDLNDLYRRVINRNNRLKRLIELHAPEIIVRNEKRMLQEAVDALVDNGRRGRAVSGSHNHKLKSLSDLLKGKQGRFRQNLLGKRVDYSGRSVIIAGPALKLHQCGLPRRMALELFKPFVMNRLVMKGYSHNIKSAKRLSESNRHEVWEILGEVIKERPVLLNRAPTLHRLGIQAFEPVLIEGSALQIHPLVCTAFNADFDGDQMAVHVPLSRAAVQEARKLMISTQNMLSPSSGEPIVAPNLDMVLGCYYITMVEDNALGTGNQYSNVDDARLAYEVGAIDIRALVKVRFKTADGDIEWKETTVGRIIFNEVLPKEMEFRNQEVEKNELKRITDQCFRKLGNEATAKMLDAIKDLGFYYSSKAGITIGINDVEVPVEKDEIVGAAETMVNDLEQQYMAGLITEEERYSSAVRIWTEANETLTKVVERDLRNYGGIYLMASSGAKGNIAQIKQMAGMRGLMSNPRGRIIDRPIKSNFREGLSVLEYFISTHGARKGLADTALRTADSGYLTRRLIDVSQEIIIGIEDCGSVSGVWMEDYEDESLKGLFADRIRHRYSASTIADPRTGEVIVEEGAPIDSEATERIVQAGISGAAVHSPLSCETRKGICGKCYGTSLATLKPTILGDAVGIIAAQSIGEPGTQLTMRTFHTGGVAGIDITSGLPRVEELFEARSPKGQAILSEIDGYVEMAEAAEARMIRIVATEDYTDEYDLPDGYKILVKNGGATSIGDPLAISKELSDQDNMNLQPPQIVARVSGTVKIKKRLLTISWSEEEIREYTISAAAQLVEIWDETEGRMRRIQDGDRVEAGQALTTGPRNPQQILGIQGRERAQKYLIEEVQKVYRSQGVPIHDKHIEVIISQMLRRVRVETSGDTDLLPDELIEQHNFEEKNSATMAEGGEPATASPVLLGITRASLNMDSFLAAASFQETTRVLTESAVNGQTDNLTGLKENVIIGRLIPARYDLTEEGRERLGLHELEPLPIVVPDSPPPPEENIFSTNGGVEAESEKDMGKVNRE